jgi:Ni2+-binding GTPase involved in maturation of urease and hydrogenase
MIDELPIDKHIEFFEIQLEEMYHERLRYIQSPVNKLWKEGNLFFGKIWSFDESKGQIILRFKRDISRKTSLPRLKVPYQLCIIGPSAPSNPKEFTFTYDSFRQHHTSKHSRCYPVYTFKGEENWRFFGCEQVSMELILSIKGYLDRGIHPMIILGEEDPPYQYLINLKDFVSKNSSNKVLNLGVDLLNNSWNPRNLPSHDMLLECTLNLMKTNDKLVIQGPPGTGKTHLIAGICADYLANKKSVCVTALTNKALGEVCDKKPLSYFLSNNHIYKTTLTSDERRKHKGLKEAKDLMAGKAELLLSSYYKLSDALKDISQRQQKYDLLIIEEASQAYLATIAGFIQLGTKVLIIGDPMQMFPIIKGEQKLKKLHPNIELAVRGLEVYSYSYEALSYRITETFRLTNEAAYQTGIFYDNSLKSVSPLNGCTNVQSSSNFLPKNGETLFVLHKISATSEELIHNAVNLAIDIRNNNSAFEIAILTNLKRSVENIYDHIFDKYNSVNGFTIETIDRIQGMTCDICIVVVESSSVFAFQLNRFNVSTSRSTRGTIFITRDTINSLQSANGLVRKFINSSTKISV